MHLFRVSMNYKNHTLPIDYLHTTVRRFLTDSRSPATSSSFNCHRRSVRFAAAIPGTPKAAVQLLKVGIASEFPENAAAPAGGCRPQDERCTEIPAARFTVALRSRAPHAL